MENRNAFVKTFPLVWIFTVIVAGILWAVLTKEWALSFVLGSVTSLMMMSMLFKSTKKVLDSKSEDARKIVTRSYIFRYAFYAIILVTAALLERFEIIGVIAGLFSFKICLYFSLFLERRGEK
jgi:F0F1-type ATP synthase assembly protein I